MTRSATFPLVAALLLAAACADSFTPPEFLRVAQTATFDVDPHPEDSTGLFIPDVNPGSCFRDVNYNIAVDADWDWLDDNCELALAQAFAPEFRYALTEQCPGNEPVWAANYFPGTGNGPVRIAYMPAYYDDCQGNGFDHFGDSEFVTVEVVYDPGRGHWVMQMMWLSAHYGSPNDRSRWVDHYSTEWPVHPRGYPRIYVAARSHGNYESQARCFNSFTDACGGGTAERYSITSDRNSGSRHRDLMGCVFSYGQNSGTGRTECFYTTKAFKGWYAGTGGERAYREYLVSEKFEYSAPMGMWSPGPHPPGWVPEYYVNISGQSLVQAENLCHYFANTNLGSGTIDWFVDGTLVGSGADIWYAFSQNAVLSVLVTQGSEDEFDAVSIVTSPSAPSCPTEARPQ